MTTTPPPTTLSTPSPTTHASQADLPLPEENSIPSTEALQAMNTFKSAKPIHLIVATAVSPHLGIGLKGQLPWPSIKADMAFFRKATTGSMASTSKLNAVIMGRKTYESIPLKFRLLTNRVNVVLTKTDVRGFADRVLRELSGQGADQEHPAEYRLVDRATVDGLTGTEVSIVRRDHEQPAVVVTDSLERAVDVDAADVFCIGGAEIYGIVLKDQGLKQRVRVLQTLVRKTDSSAFECDTFWPEEMSEETGWRAASGETVGQWAGVRVPQGEQEWKRDEAVGVDIQVVGWERVRT